MTAILWGIVLRCERGILDLFIPQGEKKFLTAGTTPRALTEGCFRRVLLGIGIPKNDPQRVIPCMIPQSVILLQFKAHSAAESMKKIINGAAKMVSLLPSNFSCLFLTV